MQTVKALMNRSEEIVFQELERIASDNALRVFPKVRLSDVLEKRGKSLGSREFQFFARSHFDFVLTTGDFQPLMGIEYDGPRHNDARQIERDHIKNELCRKANFGLLRINSKHVTRLYRGMTLLRWIVEVSHLQECFDKALEEGTVPPDFDFDPLFVAGTGDGRNFPYWLSAPANQRVHKFIESLDRGTPRGWFSLSGKDGDEKICKLSYLYFGNKVVTAFTSVRQQDIYLPYYTGSPMK